MSQRVAACCCQACSDPTLGGCCIQKGNFCTCEPNKTICECTKLGGVWNSNPVCPDSCLGACCVVRFSDNQVVKCLDNITKCDCDAQAASGIYSATFKQGQKCINVNCKTCAQNPPCSVNRTFIVGIFEWFNSRVRNFDCFYCNDKDTSDIQHCDVYPNSGFSSFCLQGGWYTGFVDTGEAAAILSCTTVPLLTTTVNDPVTNQVIETTKDSLRYNQIANITVPPCGIWIKGGSYSYTPSADSHTRGCFCCGDSVYGVHKDSIIPPTTYFWPRVNYFLHGCSGLSSPDPFATNIPFDNISPPPYEQINNCPHL